MELLLSVVN
jgi:hypothetical protein